jgi:hypothetical protein
MPKREIEAPVQDWLTEEEAVAYTRFTFAYFRQLVETKFIVGVRELNRKNILYNWKGLVQALWRIELGDLPPPERLAEIGGDSPRLE